MILIKSAWFGKADLKVEELLKVHYAALRPVDHLVQKMKQRKKAF